MVVNFNYKNMTCPHCLYLFHPQFSEGFVGKGPEGVWYRLFQTCPGCGKSIVYLQSHDPDYNPRILSSFLVYPKNFSRTPLPQEVDDPQVVEDYNESSAVLADSAKASAALSRRCLQHVLREKSGIIEGNLNSEIQQVLDSNILPSDIAYNLDAIRNIGNFAAHPIKSTSTGEIVNVESNEAEWNLEVLEQLIDFYYVRPAIAKKKRDELNTKLMTAGKPPLK